MTLALTRLPSAARTGNSVKNGPDSSWIAWYSNKDGFAKGEKMSTRSTTALAITVFTACLFSSVAYANPMTRLLGFRMWNAKDCKALIRNQDMYCTTGDCKALIRNKDMYCDTSDCKAVIRNKDMYCKTGDCKAVIRNKDMYCKSGDCKALIRNSDMYCETKPCKAFIRNKDMYCR